MSDGRCTCDRCPSAEGLRRAVRALEHISNLAIGVELTDVEADCAVMLANASLADLAMYAVQVTET